MNFNFASTPRPQPMEIDQIAQYQGGKRKGKGRTSKANIRRVKMAKENKPYESKARVEHSQGSEDGKGKKIDNNPCSYSLKFVWRLAS